MRAIFLLFRLVFATLFWAVSSSFAQVSLQIVPENNAGTPELHVLEWNTDIGARYELQSSRDLSGWSIVDGYPDEATGEMATVPVPLAAAQGSMFYRVIRWEGTDTRAARDVTFLRASQLDGRVILTWDDAPNPDVAGYEITWSPGGEITRWVENGVGSYTIDGLANGTDYTFTVKTVDTSGNRSSGANRNATPAPTTIPNITLTVSPSGVNIGRTGAVTISATVSPVPAQPLRFDWRTFASLGLLDGDVEPFSEVQETSSDGTSQVTYTAKLVGNPGGTEKVNLRVYDAANPSTTNPLAIGQVEVIVLPPPPQTTVFKFAEITMPGEIEGRLTTEFATAFIFKEVPGFTRYVYRLDEEPGEGWAFGPIGITYNHTLGTNLWNLDDIIEQFGSNVFDMDPDDLARIARGGGSQNYMPDDPDDLERLEAQRMHHLRQASAVWTVTIR